MKRLKTNALLIAFFLIYTSSLNAAIIEYQLKGELYDIHERLAPFFSVGDEFEAFFSYNTGSPDKNNNPQIGSYEILNYSFQVKGTSGSAQDASFSIIDEYYVGYSQYVVWSNRVDHGLIGNNFPLSLFASGFGLYDYSGTLFSDDSLPSLVPRISDYDELSFFLLYTDTPDVLNPGYWANGAITEIVEVVRVPEPTTVSLALLGLIWLVSSKRKSTRMQA